MSQQDSGESSDSEPSRSPDHSRSGDTVDEAVATAEAGSQVEGVHTPSGQAAPGESCVEQMPEVAGIYEGRVDRTPGETASSPEPGPSPGEIGAGGAQRIAGARISDRISAGEPVPDGPPFDSDSEGNPQDAPGAGS